MIKSRNKMNEPLIPEETHDEIHIDQEQADLPMCGSSINNHGILKYFCNFNHLSCIWID